MSKSALALAMVVVLFLVLAGVGLGAAYLQSKTLEGTVLDANGAPIAQAVVTVAGHSALTDEHGYFLVHFPRGAWEIRAFAEGFQTTRASLDASDWFADGFSTRLTLQPGALRIQVAAANTHAPTASAPIPPTPAVQVTPVAAGSQKPLPDVRVSTNAPTLLQGRVLDAATRAPVPNAIVLLGEPVGANTPLLQADANGKFSIPDFSRVKKLSIKRPGYALGEFVITQGGPQEFALTPLPVKGLHLYYGIQRADAERILGRFKAGALNAAVFDVKEDPGYLLWDSQVPLAKRIGAYLPRSYTAGDEVATCRALQLYCIARMTVFKDNLLARNRPDLALHNAGGGLLYENAAYWTNPAKLEVQDYHIALAQELVALGFDEVQLDYIRYPGTRLISPVEFGTAETRVATIQKFLLRAATELRGTRAFFSGDVFGLTTATTDEQGIGQVWEQIAPNFDYISPMMYPSTWRYATNLWGTGFGIQNCSDAYACPYAIMRYGVTKARARTQNNWTLVRPWLQAYGMNLPDMLAQAQGATDGASAGYLFWNNPGLYPDGLFPQTARQ